jgi:hypothetical protein
MVFVLGCGVVGAVAFVLGFSWFLLVLGGSWSPCPLAFGVFGLLFSPFAVYWVSPLSLSLVAKYKARRDNTR